MRKEERLKDNKDEFEVKKSKKKALLEKAKQEDPDEYYTLYADIAAELSLYREQFKGKRIICPCDWDESFETEIVYNDGDFVDPDGLFDEGDTIKNVDIEQTSKRFEKDINLIKCNFIKFLVSHAEAYGIKSISVSGYNPETGKGIKFQNIDYSKYDLVITNPPFSQFNEFIPLLIKNNVEFLVIGPLNAISYKEIFNYIKDGVVWCGYHDSFSGFDLPDGSRVKRGDCLWYTNMDVKYRHDKMILTEKYDPDRYPNYFNYDGIDVDSVNAIPYDFDGHMGVPVGFLLKFNPDQFEIIGLGAQVDKKYKHTVSGDDIVWLDENDNVIYSVPYTVKERKMGNSLRISIDGKPGTAPYARLIIKNKEVFHDED